MGKLNGLTILLFLWSALAFGQMNFREGQVITNNQDTLVGYIKDCGLSRNAKECLFKLSKKSAVITYTPSEISSYHIFGYKK